MFKLRLGKRLSRSVGGDVTLFIFLLIIAAVMVVPLIFVVSTSFKPLSELWLFPPTFIVRSPTLNNYRDLFTLITDSWVPMSRYLFNTVFITVVGTVGNIVFASLAAYPLSCYRFPGSRLLFNLVVVSLMFSAVVTRIPNYIIMSRIGFIDTYFALVIPTFGSTLGLFLMKQFMDQMVHKSLLESASIDGANDWVKFKSIVMPMCKPAWLTLIIFSVQALWNLGETPLIFTEQLKTLPFALSQLAAGGIVRAGVNSAISVLMLVVPLTVFIITQSNIIETMSKSGLKD